MYEISKEFHFSASHQLEGLHSEHQCARLHGHNYILKVTLYSEGLDDVGFVLDYGELSVVKDEVDKLDHRHLNDLLSFNPTAENMCRWFWTIMYDKFNRVRTIDKIAVSISETPKTWATYSEAL